MMYSPLVFVFTVALVRWSSLFYKYALFLLLKTRWNNQYLLFLCLSTKIEYLTVVNHEKSLFFLFFLFRINLIVCVAPRFQRIWYLALIALLTLDHVSCGLPYLANLRLSHYFTLRSISYFEFEGYHILKYTIS